MLIASTSVRADYGCGPRICLSLHALTGRMSHNSMMKLNSRATHDLSGANQSLENRSDSGRTTLSLRKRRLQGGLPQLLACEDADRVPSFQYGPARNDSSRLEADKADLQIPCVARNLEVSGAVGSWESMWRAAGSFPPRASDDPGVSKPPMSAADTRRTCVPVKSDQDHPRRDTAPWHTSSTSRR